jgi:hypothetical protein
MTVAIELCCRSTIVLAVAGPSGRSAQLVNVFEDSSMRWNALYLGYEESYTVTADVVEFDR